VLDGFHRLDACSELGIDPPVVKRTFKTDQERKEHALILNIIRRHLGQVSWGNAFKELCELRGLELGRGKGDPTGKTDTVSVLAEELGKNPRTARRCVELANDLADRPDLGAKVDSGEMTPKQAKRTKREDEKKKTRKTKPVPLPPTNIKVLNCDFRELDIPDESVNLIFTDPPYPKEFLPLWSELSTFAARVLKPGHLLVAYSGQFWLPECIEALSEELEYVWCGALVTNGPHNAIQRKHIWSRSKPLLFFSNGKYEPGEWFEDTVFSEGRQKDEHDWQQSIGPAKDIISKLLKPGDLVLDPFAGAGTTLAAAKECNCSAIGCDTDEIAVDTILRRLDELSD